MRKLFIWFCLVAMLLALSVSVSAAPIAKSVSSHATVSHDGTCQVTMSVGIQLDQA